MTQWHNLPGETPPKKPGFGSRRPQISELVLLYVGENSYSDRQVTVGYYDYGCQSWEYLEEKFSRFSPKAWAKLPSSPHSED